MMLFFISEYFVILMTHFAQVFVQVMGGPEESGIQLQHNRGPSFNLSNKIQKCWRAEWSARSARKALGLLSIYRHSVQPYLAPNQLRCPRPSQTPSWTANPHFKWENSMLCRVAQILLMIVVTVLWKLSIKSFSVVKSHSIHYLSFTAFKLSSE